MVFGARPAISAAAALPALFSSMKLIVELITSNETIPTKSCQSGGLPCISSILIYILIMTSNYIIYIYIYKERESDVTPPFANAIAMTAAASMTHDRGFHMKPKNFRNLLSCYRELNS